MARVALTSLWARIADLPLVVEDCASETLVPGPEFSEEMHSTRLVRLSGAGEEGRSEDITLFFGAAPELALAGEWTLASFAEHLAGLKQWVEPPEWEPAWRWRNWGYEAAALDLALRQAGMALHDALGLEPRPVTFVNSLGLGEPASVDTIHRRLEHHPGLRFKLDAAPDWSEAIVDALVDTGAVHTVDFKGRYQLEVKDAGALRAMYERVLAAFPDALLEDPHDLPEITPLVAPHADRVSYDAPIHTEADLDTLSLPARTINVKPCRVGTLRDLFALYAACEERGLALYGGGMGELGVGRGQVQALAALFHPDGPNDVAPPGYNALDPAPGLPPSPLAPRPAATGFGRQPDT